MNPISSAYLQPPVATTGAAPAGQPAGQGQGGISDQIQKLEQDIAQLVQMMTQGGQGAQGAGTPQPAMPQAGMPQQGAGAQTPMNDGMGNGQGLRDVKINSAAGGEALHLKEDQNGNLYNGSGNSVGTVNQDGSVTLNSGATKEAHRLESGGKEGILGMMGGLKAGTLGGAMAEMAGRMPEKGDGGSMTFSAKQVTVGAGDLNQKADF